ncbi:MAG: major capsid protein, partial [Candidatus Avelusimicrobium sp.]
GDVAAVAEVLAQNNAIIKDLQFEECNDKTGHKSTIRTGMPNVGWRKLNYGVPQSKSQTQQVRDTTGMLEAVSPVDVMTLKLARNEAEFLLSEASAFLEKMSQVWAETLFYGDVAKSPEKFNGLAVRYGTISGDAPSVKNVIDAGSSTDKKNTSIWLIGHGAGKVFGIYPEGTKAGIEKTDKGVQEWRDENGNTFEARVIRFKAYTGLCVRDWRYVVRICNINATSLNAANLMKLMIKAKRLLPSLESCKPVFYANNEVLTALEQGLYDKANVHLTLADAQSGIQELRMSQIPVHACDAIRNDEELVK